MSTLKDHAETWKYVQTELRNKLGEDVFTAWFGRVKFEDIISTTLVVSVPTDFLVGWLTQNYSSILLKLFQKEGYFVTELKVDNRGVEIGRKVAKKPITIIRHLPRREYQERVLGKLPCVITNSTKELSPQKEVEIIIQIQGLVSNHFKIDVNNLVSNCRVRKFSGPRQIAVYLAVQKIGLKPDLIARYFNMESQSIYSINGRVENKVKKDKQYAKLITEVTAELATA